MKHKSRLIPYLVKEELAQGIKNPLVLLAQGLGSGCFRPMQGTWGTLGGLLVLLIYQQLQLPLSWWLIWLAVACGGGIPLCSYAERKLQQQDPHSVVWDEWCGIWLALALVPLTPLFIVVGFVLFRYLDIKKPWLIGLAERKLSKGVGIMLDDLLAGLFTLIMLLLLQQLLQLL